MSATPTDPRTDRAARRKRIRRPSTTVPQPPQSHPRHPPPQQPLPHAHPLPAYGMSSCSRTHTTPSSPSSPRSKSPAHAALVNDIFRITHDFLCPRQGEGLGFSARGEENAWRDTRGHVPSALARRAMTTVTGGGQNGWINFGCHERRVGMGRERGSRLQK